MSSMETKTEITKEAKRISEAVAPKNASLKTLKTYYHEVLWILREGAEKRLLDTEKKSTYNLRHHVAQRMLDLGLGGVEPEHIVKPENKLSEPKPALSFDLESVEAKLRLLAIATCRVNDRKRQLRWLSASLMRMSLRISEVMNVRLDDLISDTRLMVPRAKGGKGVTVILSDIPTIFVMGYRGKKMEGDCKYIGVADMIRENLPHSVPLGKMISVGSIRSWLKSADITPHQLRHVWATRAVMAGVKPIFIQKQLGHTSLSTTLRYLHDVLPEREKAILEKMGNDRGLRDE